MGWAPQNAPLEVKPAPGAGTRCDEMLEGTLMSLDPDAPVVLHAAEGSGTFSFDSVRYEEAADRLRLSKGPPCAAATEITPEGDLLRISAPDGAVCSVVVRDVTRRLVRHGCVEVTLAPEVTVTLDADELTGLLARR